MRLFFHQPHKSITVMNEIELPNFVVLTGVNGAGKSQLLEAIEAGYLRIDQILPNQAFAPIRMFTAATLVPNSAQAYDRTQIQNEKEQLWSQLKTVIQNSTNTCLPAVNAYQRFDGMDFRKISRLVQKNTALEGDEAAQYTNDLVSAMANINAHSETAANQFISNDPLNRQGLIDSIKKSTEHLPLLAWTKEDFYENFPPSYTSVDVFQQSFGRLFTDYAVAFEQNRYRAYKNSQGGNFKVITDEEFSSKHGIPPWEFLNSVFTTAGLAFKINEPIDILERTYTPILTDETRGTEIDFSNLSSGEKVLMSFALCLYYAQDNRQIVQYPKVTPSNGFTRRGCTSRLIPPQ